MVRRSLFYFFDSLLFGSLSNSIGEYKSEEINDESREMWVFVVNSILSELQS